MKASRITIGILAGALLALPGAAQASCLRSGNRVVCTNGQSVQSYGRPPHQTQVYRDRSGAATFYNYRY